MRMAKRSPSTDTALASPHSLTSHSLPQPPGITCNAKAKGNSMGLTFFLLLLLFFFFFLIILGQSFGCWLVTHFFYWLQRLGCTNIHPVDVHLCARACVRVCVCHNEKKCQTNGKHDKRHRRVCVCVCVCACACASVLAFIGYCHMSKPATLLRSCYILWFHLVEPFLDNIFTLYAYC